MALARKLRDNFRSPRDVLLFGRIFLLITALPFLVRFLTLPRLMKFLLRSGSAADGTSDAEDYMNRVVKYTDYLLARDFWIYKKTCLKRSLALYHFLCPVVPQLDICFGVKMRKDASRDNRRGLDGHSWLARNGEVYLEENPASAKEYTVTYRYPGDSSARKTSGKNFLPDLSDENRLLLYCSRASSCEKNASELNGLLPRQMDWEFIAEAARSRNIPQLLYHNLKRLPNCGVIPVAVMDSFKEAYHETIARNLYIYAELRTILDAFHGTGIRPLALKGVALAGVVYPDIGLRPMSDIDLLVNEGELAVADRVMTGLDYIPIHSLQSQQRHNRNQFHLPPYRHATKPVVVEIHWHVTGNFCEVDIRRWWERAVSKDIMGYRILVPSSEDMLIHLCIHLFNHGYENGFVLRCLCDIFETLRHYDKEIDWQLLEGKLGEQGIERQVHSMLLLTKRLYASEDDSFIPLDLVHADRHFLHVLESSLFTDNGNAPINPHLLKSMMLGNLSKKIRYLLPKIFLPRRQMTERYPSSSLPLVVLLHYLVRPFHLLARYGKPAMRIFRTERDEAEKFRGFRADEHRE